jgi:hypothetical protein
MMTVETWDGKPITKPGIYSGISLPIYHGAMLFGDEPSLSSTALRTIWAHSVGKYWASSVYNPARVEDEINRGMVLGRALHHCAQAEKFTDVFIVQPSEIDGLPWQGNRKECKRWKRRQEESGLVVVTQTETVALGGMLASLKQNEFVKRGGLNGLIECSFFWKDRETNIWLKARPDAIPTDSGNFCDLKKTTSVSIPDLSNTIARFNYHQQASLVLAGARELGLPAETFTLLFCESEPPFSVQDATLEQFDVDRGVEQNRVAIRKFEHSWMAWKKNKKYRWPGSQLEESGLGRIVALPDWARLSIDKRLERELGRAA